MYLNYFTQILKDLSRSYKILNKKSAESAIICKICVKQKTQYA
jgi:hypothetical protein